MSRLDDILSDTALMDPEPRIDDANLVSESRAKKQIKALVLELIGSPSNYLAKDGLHDTPLSAYNALIMELRQKMSEL